MLPVSFVLRGGFLFALLAVLVACVVQQPIPVAIPIETPVAMPIEAPVEVPRAVTTPYDWEKENAESEKQCPAYLLNPDLYYDKDVLAIEQLRVGIYCDLEKDGTLVFADPYPAFPATDESMWLLVDTQKLQIEVKRGEETVATFENIAIGQSGAGYKKRRGDNITPLGDYKIGWINDKSQFYVFYGLTYPSIADAKDALKKGLISQNEYAAIFYAQQHNRVPPQNTPLGGQIGLHGLGRADAEVHQAINWTHGCVAVTNSQLDQLSQWISPGMVVKIK